jgi:tetratricopeptide (TPR) repeat protein
MANSPRWKDKRDKFIRSDFVGRQDQLIAFRASVTDPAAEKMIFAISGQGGVGKTTLLKEFRRIAEECKHIAAYVDEGSATNRVDDVPEALYRLAKDFENQNPNYKFEKFQERYKTYRQKRQELEADPEAPSGIASGVGRLGTRLAVESVNLIPGMSLVSGLVDTDKVVEKGGDLLSFAWKKFNSKDEVQLVTEPLEVLTPLFLEEINRIAEKQRVVLLLDTYEVTGIFLDDWLRGVLDCRYGEDLTDNFRLGIAGREPLDRNAWVELEFCIARSPLEPFTEAEAKQFLAKKGITSEAVVAQIWQLSSGGLPLLVSMMAQNAPTSPDAVVDPCGDAVERFLKWEQEPTKRQLAQEGAIPRVLNEDVVNVLGDGQFEWLQGCAFMIRDGSQWRYHLVVREQMVRYQRQRSPKRWAELHGKLATYYEELGQGLGLEAGQEARDEGWRELALEWLYHELCAAPQGKLNMALNGFLTALNESDTFAQNWAVVMVQAGQEANCKELQRWGERLRDELVAYQEDRYEEAIPTITALLQENIEKQLQPIALGWIGYILGELGRYEEVLIAYNKALEIKPDDPIAWNNRGIALGNLGRNEEAIASYDNALEIKPDLHEAWNNRGVALMNLGRNEEAISSYDKALEIKSDYHYAWNNRGIALGNLGRNKEAIASYDNALEIKPDLHEAWNNQGIALMDLGRNEEAISSYDKALEIKPNYHQAWYNGGIALRQLGRNEEAISTYDKALEIKPDDHQAWYNRGVALRYLGRNEEAISTYDKALEFKPDYREALINRGTILCDHLRLYAKALDDFNRCIEIKSDDYLAWFNRGIALGKSGRYEEAIASYDKALEIKPDLHEAWYNRGFALGNLGRYEEAIASYDKALEINSDKHEAWFNRGIALINLGRYEEVIASYDKALEIKPDLHEAWYNRGIALGNLGRYEEAIASYNEALEINSDKHEAWFNRGVDLGNLGRNEEAISSYDKALEIYRKIGLRKDEADTLKQLAELHQVLGKVEVARQYCQQALALATELGIPLAAECEALLLKIENDDRKED